MATEIVPAERWITQINPAFADQIQDEGILNLLQQVGVQPDDLVPAPDTGTTTINFENLCTHREPAERKGYAIEHDGHTGPMILLGVTQDRESDQFVGYYGYCQIAALHPVLGKTLTSVSIPAIYRNKDGEVVPTEEVLNNESLANELTKEPGDNDLLMWLRTVKPGMYFTIARIPTNKPGRHVNRPIPVQGLS